MRITDCESWIISFPCNPASRDADDDHVEVIGVDLTTDDGTRASGFTFTDDGGGGQAIKALIDGLLLPLIRGSEVEPPRAVWPRLWDAVHQLGRGVATMAIAAVDIALWDLQARLHDRPLAREIGQLRDAVPAYGSGKASPFHTIDELIELTMTFVAEDVRAVKVRIGVDPVADVERIAAVREAVGPRMRVMLDANERLDLATALWLTERVREFDISWLEEPLQRDQLSGLQRLRAASRIPLAHGEHLFGAAEFLPFVNGGAVDVVQPDACMVGGITEMLRVGELAAINGIALAPHHVPELHIHVAAALPTAAWVERFPIFEGLLEHELEVRDGQLLVPDRPGHGIVFTERCWSDYRIA